MGRKRYGSAPAQFEMREIAGDGPVAAKLRERVDVAIADDLATIFSRGRDCLLDLSEVRFIDSTGVALLIRLRRQIRSIHRQLVLVGPAKCVQRALAFMKLEDYFDIAPDARTASEIIAERQSEEAFCVAKRSLDAAPEVAWLGEITANSASEVWSRTQHLLETPVPPPSVVIDLSDARFIDSTGLRIMVQTLQLAQLRGTRLIFAGARPAVRSVLRNAGLDLLLLEKPELLNLIAAPISAP
jgi:anti-anti-sigma factor